MTFHSLSLTLFSRFTGSSQKGEAVTTAGCSSWSVQVLCYHTCTGHYVVWLGKGGS